MEDRETVINRMEIICNICKENVWPTEFSSGIIYPLLRDAISILKEQKARDVMDIRDIDGLWCDDITFCQEECGWKSCPRNKKNIRDRTVPHSFSVEIPEDCPKRQEGR